MRKLAPFKCHFMCLQLGVVVLVVRATAHTVVACVCVSFIVADHRNILIELLCFRACGTNSSFVHINREFCCLAAGDFSSDRAGRWVGGTGRCGHGSMLM